MTSNSLSMEHASLSPSPSLKQKGLQRLKSLKLQTCFFVPDLDHDEQPPHQPTNRSPRENGTPRLVRWKSSSERAKHYLSSKFGSASRHRRRYSSDEMKYDAMSYALNFDDGSAGNDATAEEYVRRNFSARLPASPPGRA